MATYADRRTRKQKDEDEYVLECVKRGIALLQEEHGPGWVEKINLNTLRLNNASQCVLGQVYAREASTRDGMDGYDVGTEVLGLREEDIEEDEGPEYYGFDITYGSTYTDLDEAWQRELKALKRP